MVTTLAVIISPIDLIVVTGLTLMDLNVVYDCEKKGIFPDILLRRLRSLTILFGRKEIKIKNGLLCPFSWNQPSPLSFSIGTAPYAQYIPGDNFLNRLARLLQVSPQGTF